MDYAAAVNEEIKDLFAAGADVVQIDEPYMQARPEKARQYGLKALNRALEGVHRHDRGAHLLRLRGDHPRAAERLLVPARAGAVQLPAGLDRDRAVAPRLLGAAGARRQARDGRLHRPRRPEGRDRSRRSSQRIERALPYVKPENVILAPDCGMKYLPRERGDRQAAGDGRGGEDPAREARLSRRGARRCCSPSCCSTRPGMAARRLEIRPEHKAYLARRRRADRLRRPAARRRRRR